MTFKFFGTMIIKVKYCRIFSKLKLVYNIKTLYYSAKRTEEAPSKSFATCLVVHTSFDIKLKLLYISYYGIQIRILKIK